MIAKALASFVCVGLFILIIWKVTGFGPNTWQCWVLSISANLMLVPGFFSQKPKERL